MAFRDGPFDNIKVPLVWTAAVVALVALVGSIVLLVGDSRDDQTSGVARTTADAATGTVGGVLAAPVRGAESAGRGIRGYFFAVSENRRLRRENAELQAWRDQAIALKTLNERYERLMGIRSQPPVALATGRAVSDARGPFANARILDIGADRGVQVGQPVIDEHGLVGRIVGVSAGASRMLMATDVASRIPVLVDRTDARAIMTGDGSRNPRLSYLREGGQIQAGDRILSSGDGGGFPRGVPIGVAARGLDGSWRVKLYSDRGPIDFVRVMLFRPFTRDIDPAALYAPPLAGVAVTPPPEPQLQPVPREPTVATPRPGAGAAAHPAAAPAPARTAPPRPQSQPAAPPTQAPAPMDEAPPQTTPEPPAGVA